MSASLTYYDGGMATGNPKECHYKIPGGACKSSMFHISCTIYSLRFASSCEYEANCEWREEKAAEFRENLMKQDKPKIS